MANRKLFKTKKRNNQKFKRTRKINNLKTKKGGGMMRPGMGGMMTPGMGPGMGGMMRPGMGPGMGMMAPGMGMMAPGMGMMGPGMGMGMVGENSKNKNNPETKMVNKKQEKINADKAIVIDVDGDKIDLRKVQQKKNKTCKKDPFTCATINLKRMMDQQTKLVPDEDTWGKLIEVPDVVPLSPKSSYGLKKPYKKMCLGNAMNYEAPKPDTRQPFSLPSKTNQLTFGTEYFYPHYVDILLTKNPADYFNKMSSGMMQSMGMNPAMGGMGMGMGGMNPAMGGMGMGMGMGMGGMNPAMGGMGMGMGGMNPAMSGRTSSSKTRKQRGGKQKKNLSKKNKQAGSGMSMGMGGRMGMGGMGMGGMGMGGMGMGGMGMGGMGMGGMPMGGMPMGGMGMGMMGIHPALSPKIEVGKDGIPRPNFAGTLLFPTILKEGLVLESHDDSIFFRPDKKETCYIDGPALEYNLGLGQPCKMDEQCQSRACSGMKILGKQLPGKCINMTLLNSIGKGGICNQTSECKGSLQCLQGVCSSVDVDLKMSDFASEPGAIASERTITDDSLLKNPINELLEENPIDIEDSSKVKCENTKECLKYDKNAFCKNGACEKKYKSCQVKNSLVCTKLGDVRDFDKSSKSFVKEKGCCVQPNNVCIHNPDAKSKGKSDGICVDLKSTLDFDLSKTSEYNLPNKSRCLKSNNCASGFCNKRSNQCESIFQADRECDSLYPCPLSDECVNGECIPIDKLPENSARAQSGCSASTKNVCQNGLRCIGSGDAKDRDIMGLNQMLVDKKDKMLYPMKKSSRLFVDTSCGFENIKTTDYPYGICDSDLKKVELFQQQMSQMKNNIYNLFKNKLRSYNIKLDGTQGVQIGGGGGPRSMIEPIPEMFRNNAPKPPSKKGIEKLESLPKLILFNNFDYENFDKAASFDVFDYTSQNAIVFFEGRYVLAKAYMQLRNPFFDDDENDSENFTYDILVMFLDHSRPEVKNGFELKKMGKYIRCFYSGNSNKFSGLKKYNVFQPFPEEFGISNNTRGGFSPNGNNPNILLVPNLFMYEYLVFLLFGERIVCSPYKKFGYQEPDGGLSKNENGFNRGYYQYSLRYDGLGKSLIDKLVSLEANWGQNLGYYGTIDIPYTTLYRASDLDGRKLNDFFFGTDSLGVTPEIFKKLFSVWKTKIIKDMYTNLSPILMIQIRKHNHQTFLLRFKEDSEFKKIYVNLGLSMSDVQTKTTVQKGGSKNELGFTNKKEFFELAVDDTFKKYEPNTIDEEQQITLERGKKKKNYRFILEFEPREEGDFTKEMNTIYKQIKHFNNYKLKSKEIALKQHNKKMEKETKKQAKPNNKTNNKKPNLLDRRRGRDDKMMSQGRGMMGPMMGQGRGMMGPGMGPMMGPMMGQGRGMMGQGRGMMGPMMGQGRGMMGPRMGPMMGGAKKKDEYKQNLMKSISEQRINNEKENKTDVGFDETNIHSVFSEFFKPKL